MTGRLPTGIRQIGNSYIVDITHKGRRLTATVHSLVEAKAKRAELAYKLMHGGAGRDVGSKTGKVWTLGEALDRTTAIAWSRTSAGFVMIRNAQAAVKFFGRSRPLDTIGTETIDEWIFELEKIGNSDSTINRKLSSLSKMMTVAIERGRLENKPKLPYRKEVQGRMRFLTEEEEETVIYLLRQWSAEIIADGVIVLLDTGIRIGELLRLKEKDIDFKAGLIHIWQSKTYHPRAIPMTTRVRTIIEGRRTRRGENPLFPVKYHQFKRAWERVRSHMGYVGDPQFVIHSLRHTCAARLIQRGASLRLVQEWLGHKTFIVTLRYAHLTPGDLIKAARMLETPR